MNPIYFFKKASGQWVLGFSKSNIIIPGEYVRIVDADGNVSVMNLNNLGRLINCYPINLIRKENDTAYANLAELYAATDSFFVKTIQTVNASGVDTSQYYVETSFTITRPANTTVYSAGDVIANTNHTVDLLKFLDVSKVANSCVNIVNVNIFTTDTGLAGKAIDLHVYNEAPISPIADNAPMVINSANAMRRKGTLSLRFGTGTRANVAQDLFTNLALRAADRSIYFQVETTEGFPPSANSTTITVKATLLVTS